MRIAIVAPPFGESSGPEYITRVLFEALVAMGSDVTLFAPADWAVKGRHVATLPQSIRSIGKLSTYKEKNLIAASQVKILSSNDFDIVHLQSKSYAYAVGTGLKVPCLLTIHNRMKPDNVTLIKESGIVPVAISHSQAAAMSVSQVINNGLDIANIPWSEAKSGYLVFVGRMVRQKGIDSAIKIARIAHKKLLIFGRKSSKSDEIAYFDNEVSPHIDGTNVEYFSEVPREVLFDYLMKADALILPISQPEVFPTVVIESLACGTPVIGTDIDPLPEQLSENDKISFLSNNITDLARVARDCSGFDAKQCREYAENNFSAEAMAREYLKLYRGLTEND
jgi:glycosyltransferase involved in cell wall biosynthesis